MRAQMEVDSGGQRTLLLFDPGAPQRLTARINRRWAGVVARALGSPLDRRLAEGRPPESGLLLAARAQLLVSPVKRMALAQSWEGLLVQAGTPPVRRDPRVPLNRVALLACESELRQLLGAVVAPLPTPARGLAMASRLLTDGTGPVYRPCPPAELGSALRAATAQLDPRRSLMPGR